MELRIVAVHGNGEYSKEYVMPVATQDCNLEGYVLADNTSDAKGNRSNKVRHTFWFPNTKVKAGELV